MNRRIFLAHGAASIAATALAARLRARDLDAQHGIVWRESGRYGGWPANHGIWSWDDEIVVGFTAGVLKTGDPNRHPIDRSAGEQHVLARSLDGGRRWTIETPAALQPPPRPERRAVTREALVLPALRRLDAPIDFTEPGLALTFRAAHGTAGAWMFVGRDRGTRWSGPHPVPALDTRGFDPRTDYVALGRHDLLVFMTALKTDGKEGRPVTLRTRDGGQTWERLGWIGPETDGFRIMPATVRLRGDQLYSVIRRRDGERHHLEGYRSDDLGLTWQPTGIVVADTGRGNPAALVRLADGRLVCTYGLRATPFGIFAVISTDDGRTWSAPRALHAGAADWDLGYPRTVVRRDGRLVTVYYFNDPSGPERYIGYSLWQL